MNWSEEEKRDVVRQGSLSINGGFLLGECYEGTFHCINGEPKVFFSEEKKELMRNPHADIRPCDCFFQEGEKIKVRITFIFPSSGMSSVVTK